MLTHLEGQAARTPVGGAQIATGEFPEFRAAGEFGFPEFQFPEFESPGSCVTNRA